MDTKPIAELIHDRVFIEGGTLHVWLTGAKFRRMTTKRIARSYHDRTSEELLDIFDTFTPSDELKRLMVRYAEELRSYLRQSVDEWATECAAKARVKSAATPPNSVGSSPDRPAGDPNPKGRNDRECHGGVSAAVSRQSAISAAADPADGHPDRTNLDGSTPKEEGRGAR